MYIHSANHSLKTWNHLTSVTFSALADEHGRFHIVLTQRWQNDPAHIAKENRADWNERKFKHVKMHTAYKQKHPELFSPLPSNSLVWLVILAIHIGYSLHSTFLRSFRSFVHWIGCRCCCCHKMKFPFESNPFNNTPKKKTNMLPPRFARVCKFLASKSASLFFHSFAFIHSDISK